MKHFVSASLVALAVGVAAMPGLAQDTAPPGGFRLPTNPSATPTPTDVQGPVDPDAPILTRPRAPTPTPTPRATATPTSVPTPAPSPTPRVVSPPRNSSLPPRFTPPAAPTPRESEAVVGNATPFPTATPDSAPVPLPTVTSGPAPLDNPGVATPTAKPGDSPDDGIPGWLYALGGLLVAGAVGAAFWMRRRTESEVEAPAIVPPRPKAAAGDPGPDPVAPPPAGPTGPVLAIDAQVSQLARSMRFATLSYELRVTNRGAQPLTDVNFGADLVTAHARVPAQAQLADPAMPLAPVQTVARLDPGETATFTGDFRLPVEEIRPIPHGKAVVYVPLLRVRADAAGTDPVARTFIVGLRSPGAQRLQPFRLDEMPQTYRTIGSRALD